MCVAIYKPAGVECPSIDILKACWDSNPDGRGFYIAQYDGHENETDNYYIYRIN